MMLRRRSRRSTATLHLQRAAGPGPCPCGLRPTSQRTLWVGQVGRPPRRGPREVGSSWLKSVPDRGTRRQRAGTGLDAAVGALFAFDVEAGDLAAPRPARPTLTVSAPTVDMKEASFWAGPRGPMVTGAPVVLAAPGRRLHAPVDPLLGVHEEWTRRIVSAGDPALWGYARQSVLGTAALSPGPCSIVRRNAEANLALWEWVTTWLRPEGTFPDPHRQSGDGVPGLASPSDEVVEGLPQAAGRAPSRSWAAAVVPLGRIARRWACAAEHGSPTVTLPGRCVRGPMARCRHGCDASPLSP